MSWLIFEKLYQDFLVEYTRIWLVYRLKTNDYMAALAIVMSGTLLQSAKTYSWWLLKLTSYKQLIYIVYIIQLSGNLLVSTLYHVTYEFEESIVNNKST